MKLQSILFIAKCMIVKIEFMSHCGRGNIAAAAIQKQHIKEVTECSNKKIVKQRKS